MEKKMRKLIIVIMAMTGVFMPTIGVCARENEEVAAAEEVEDDSVARATMVLSVGIEANDSDLVCEALEAGADPYACNETGIRFIDLGRSCSEEIIGMLEKKAAEKKVAEKRELNALLFSNIIHSDAASVVRELLEQKADVNARNDNGNTPVMLAVQGGRSDLVTLLIKNKADVNAVNNQGMAPVDFAPGGQAFAAIVKRQIIKASRIYEQMTLLEMARQNLNSVPRQEEKKDTEE